MSARTLMLQGTGSEVGKSLLTAGLARAAVRRGLRVRPFKAQNMSNNAAVTPCGGEIGRAQALQARAAGVVPSVDMNPVLLKPQTDTGAQVVVRGQVRGTREAAAYQADKPFLLGAVMESFRRLAAEADLVLVEGAGSPAEVNLRAGDIANMGFARAAHVPVVLIGDIDRGGVIASLVGTAALLDAADRALVRGFVINKFRGDLSLFDGGLEAITQHTGWRSFGVVPYWAAAMSLPSEDAVILQTVADKDEADSGVLRVAVPCFRGIANFDDLDPLRLDPAVRLDFIGPGRPLPADADLIILPGTKSTLGDLGFLRAQGWDIDILAHVRRGGSVLGLCGGYQMLGGYVRDPHGVDGAPGEALGLGLLDVETVMAPEKRLALTRAREQTTGLGVAGYEIHAGVTGGPDGARPLLVLADGRRDGAVSLDGRVMGCYLHGLFADDAFRRAFIARLSGQAGTDYGYEAQVERTLDALADHLEAHLDVAGLLACAA